MPTTTINANAAVTTLINHFTVPEEHQRELVGVLVRATEEVMRHQPGFVAANIHASQDGTSVVNYAQWATEADFKSMLDNPACQEHMAEAANLARVEPHLYTVESVHHI